MAFRRDHFFLRGCASQVRHSLTPNCFVAGKAKPFRTSGGKAANTSQFQNARIIDIQRFPITKDGDDDSQTYRGFRRRYGHDDKNKQLP